MSEIEKQIGTEELLHPKRVSETVKALRKIDGFMYDSAAIKSALDAAFSQGKVGIFMLDCIVADQIAEPGAVGKLPSSDPIEASKISGLIGQMGSIKYIVETLKGKGLDVSCWGFLGDDDFQYSVSEKYSIANPAVKQGVSAQITAIGEEFENTSLVASEIEGWLTVEKSHPEIVGARDFVQNHIAQGVETGNFPAKALQRFKKFVDWRIALVESVGFDLSDYRDLITKQAIQEMVSFVLQGHFAPLVIRKKQPGLPLIFANTYPELGVQHLDDVCLRLGKQLGLNGYQYGTIHLPGPEKLKKFLGEPIDPNAPPPILYGCNVSVQGKRKQEWRRGRGLA